MSTLTDDRSTLKQDATLDEFLRRVAYEAGMMLGLEATRDEQTYHRRRLTRHQYWMHGFGTLAGMAVSLSPDVDADDNPTVRLNVSPGLGIDGLGREVLIHEPYCIDLGEWLDVQKETYLRQGYSDADDQLYLNVTVRQKDCDVAAQPVLARKLNLSTDAVQPSRTADSVLLELVPALAPESEPGFQPWQNHDEITESLPELTTEEQATLAGTSGETNAQLTLHARLLHALESKGVGTKNLADKFDEGARLLLARVTISTEDVNTIQISDVDISINNLVRPFLVTASQLAWLARQP